MLLALLRMLTLLRVQFMVFDWWPEDGTLIHVVRLDSGEVGVGCWALGVCWVSKWPSSGCSLWLTARLHHCALRGGVGCLG